MTLLELSHIADARSTLELAEKESIKQGDHALLNAVGLWCLYFADYARAEVMFRRAITNDPDSGSYLANYSYARLRRGDAAEAIEYARKSRDAGLQAHGVLQAVIRQSGFDLVDHNQQVTRLSNELERMREEATLAVADQQQAVNAALQAAQVERKSIQDRLQATQTSLKKSIRTRFKQKLLLIALCAMLCVVSFGTYYLYQQRKSYFAAQVGKAKAQGFNRGQKIGFNRGQKIGFNRGQKMGFNRGQKMGLAKATRESAQIRKALHKIRQEKDALKAESDQKIRSLNKRIATITNTTQKSPTQATSGIEGY